MVTPHGFEPQLAGSEPAVLPLDDGVLLSNNLLVYQKPILL